MIYDFLKWTNENQGVLTILIFLFTILLGWTSGIFQSLRRKPKFKIEILPGPSLCSTFPIEEKYNDYNVHKTAIALYLKVTNVGNAPSSIDNVSAGYHWHLHRLNWMWLKYCLMWFWLEHPIVSMQDFQYDFGGNIKIYPFLLQRTVSIMNSPDVYLLVGQSVNGVVYFEQSESWGGCFPSPQQGMTKIRVRVRDSFGKGHYQTTSIPVVDLEEAKKYCPSFGDTFMVLRNQQKQGFKT
jgi:hypothetical protein